MQPQIQPFRIVNPNQSVDLSELDLGAQMAGVQSSGGLNVQFFYSRVKISSKNAEVDGSVQTRLCVAKQPRGDRLTIAVAEITEMEAMRDFPREFALFKQYEEVPTMGTPLMELPGSTQSEIALLTLHGLRSIEDLAECPADVVNQIGFEAQNAHKRARLWMERKEKNAPLIDVAEMEARHARERDAMMQRLEAMEKRNAELQTLIAGMQMAQGQRATIAEPMLVESRDKLPDIPDNDPFTDGEAFGTPIDLNAGEIDPIKE